MFEQLNSVLKMTWQAMTRTLLAKVSYKKRNRNKKENGRE